jgi:preprotein translocase subunit SecF
MFIVHRRKIFYILSSILVITSITGLVLWGLKFSIEFKGGSLMELQFKDSRPSNQEINDSLNSLNLGEIIIQPTAEKNVLLRFKEADETLHQNVLNALKSRFNAEEITFETVGPTISNELKTKAVFAVILAEAFMIVYLAWAFRKTSFIVKSYKYGILAAVSLLHDITIVTGLFAFLGHFMNVEIGLTFVAAILTILGYSVNDTIVVYDRIRESLLRLREKETFEELVDKSLKQTLARSINTTLTVLICILAVLLFGGASIRYFMLALFVGVASGAYSSFLAAFLLLDWERAKMRTEKA